MATVSTVSRSKALIDDLGAALEEAERGDSDLPSDRAQARALEVLRRIACSSVPISTVESVIPVDGSVEFTVVLGKQLATIDISPSGSTIEMIVQDLGSEETSWPSQTVTEAEVVERLERLGAN